MIEYKNKNRYGCTVLAVQIDTDKKTATLYHGQTAPMYVDTKDGDALQVGYVITGKTDFEKGDRAGWSTQYIDLWVSVEQIETPDF